MSWGQTGPPTDAATLTAAVAAEAALRSSADSTLTTSVSTEASTRASADTTLATADSTEASARATADALKLAIAQNLADVQSAATARTNLAVAKTGTKAGIPTVSDDNTAGYAVGSTITNTSATPRTAYQCTNAATGAAIWLQVGVAVVSILASGPWDVAVMRGISTIATSTGTLV